MDVDNLPPTLVQAGKNNQLKVGHPINDGYSFISTRSFPIRPVLPQNTKKEEKKKDISNVSGQFCTMYAFSVYASFDSNLYASF
jgi:hypothetical protein